VNLHYYIGCSGYYYPNWKNKFYPKGLQPKGWLAYYSTVFNSVELNGSFYRTPKLSDLQRYREVTTADFTFSVKMSRYITHTRQLKDCGQDIATFQDLMTQGLAHKLGCFLFQMPPSFHFSEENLALVIAQIPHRLNNIIEFRHSSWWNPDTEKALKEAHITFCNVDYPKLNSYFINTTSLFYLRLHGKPELFKSPYSVGELRDFRKEIPATASPRYIYFNNTYYDAGYTNARQFMELTSRE